MSRKVNTKKTNNAGNFRGKGNGRGNKFSTDECPKCGYSSNNPAWYTGNPIAAKKAGSINFSYPMGYNIDLGNPLFPAADHSGSFSLPGMMALDVLPSMGRSMDASSALNLAAFKLYSFIRHENSGSRNYDSPDLLLYVAAVTDVYSYITWLQRTYLVCNSYSVMNEYIPRAYCELSHIDFDDMIANLADFAYQLDNRINKVRSFKVPGDMPIFQRRAFMFKDLYTEGDSIKDQMYFYNPAGFYQFKLDESGAGMLHTVGLAELTGIQGTFSLKVKDLFVGLDALIAKIAEQEDFGIMSGDILKAYGANIVTLAPFDPAPGVGVAPVRDIAVLEQIQNSTVLGKSTIDNKTTTYQFVTDVMQSTNKNYLVTEPGIAIMATNNPEGKVEMYAKKALLENRLLTSRTSDPSPEQVLESTRTMVIATNFTDQVVGSKLSARVDLLCGTELITDCNVVFYQMAETGERALQTLNLSYALGVDVNADSQEWELTSAYWMMTLLSQFDYHPCVRVCVAKHSATVQGDIEWVKAYTAFNTSEYTIVTADVLRRLHDTALMSLLHV